MSPGAPGSPDRSCQEPVSTVKRHKQFADDHYNKLKVSPANALSGISLYFIKSKVTLQAYSTTIHSSTAYAIT